MLYTQKTLLPEEKVLYHTKPHYIIFYPVFLWMAIAIWIFISDHRGVLSGPLLSLMNIFGLLAVLMSMFSCVTGLISYYCSEYVITNKRILMKVGFISSSSLETFLERIEGVSVEQSVVGRMLGYGTVIVGGIGGTKNSFFYIPDPFGFRNNVQQHTETANKS